MTDSPKRNPFPARNRTNRANANPLARRLAGMGVLVAAAFFVAACSDTGTQGETASANQCSISSEMTAALKPLAIGEVAAFAVSDTPEPMDDLAFNNGDGSAAKLSDFSGKTVLLNLWATWCAPCRHEMPSLMQLNDELGGDRFQVVPVSVDRGSDEKPKAFYDEINLSTLPFYHDPTFNSFNTLKKRSLALGLPASVLIGPDGCILGKLNGPAEWASDDAKALVKAGMTEK